MRTFPKRLAPIFLGLTATLLTAGCETEPSSQYVAYVPRPASCPNVQPYSREFLNKAAQEQARLPKGSALETLLEDYLMMRDSARQCLSRNAYTS